MHYLEDFLELLEPLRETMRENLTLMRENDLKFQVDHVQLEEDTNQFLTDYRLYQKTSSLSPSKSKININQHLSNDENHQLTSEQRTAREEKQKEYDQLFNRHKQLFEITTKKINLANNSQDIVERYYKKLENDLHKFKMELEADYAGVTEILEKRFENENYQEYDERINENSNFDPSLIDLEPLLESYDDITLSNSLNEDYFNGFLTSQTRRLPTGLTPCMLSRKQQQRLQAASRGRKRLQEKSKRKRNTFPDSPYINPSDSDPSSPNASSNPGNSLALTGLFDDEINLLENYSTQPAIDERRYCFCNEMSYGEMIACDNPNCRREWFHYSCVGIVTPPKGKWFCADCIQIVQQKVSK